MNNNTSILPNITLGAEIRDDCYSGTIALEESLKFVQHAFGQEGAICPDPRKSPVMGVVGTVSSQTATSVASLLRLFRLPQISYGATSPDLSDRDEYEYFMRTVPSDDCQAEAIVDIIHQLGWTSVFLISSSGNYGERIRERFVGLAKNPNRSLCLVDELKIGAPKGESSLADSRLKKEIGQFLDKINETRSVRGVVLLTESLHAEIVLKTVKSKGFQPGRFLWLCSDTWGVGQDLKGVEDIAEGAISIALHNPKPTSLEKFNAYFEALKPGANPKNPWFDVFWEDNFNCSISKNNSSSNGRRPCTGNESWLGDKVWDDDKVPYVFDSVYAFAHGLDAMLRETNSSLTVHERLEKLAERGFDLLWYLNKTSFTGKSGNVSFDVNGNGVSRYDIMSYMNEKYTKITMWSEGGFTNRNIEWFQKRRSEEKFSSRCGKPCKIGEGKVEAPYCVSIIQKRFPFKSVKLLKSGYSY